MTVDYSNDKLLGFSQWASDNDVLSDYKTSRTRVCVTVGMMTTGWDCPNILNLGLMRPIYSPSEFIQIKGRGTRIYNFEHKYKDGNEVEVITKKKETFKLFDFFAICEYFEEKFDYDQVLKLASLNPNSTGLPVATTKPKKDGYNFEDDDAILTFQESKIGFEGMKVDRMLFQQFEENIKNDQDIIDAIGIGNMDSATALTIEKYINQADNEFTLEKLRKALKIDRKISVREILDLIFNGNEIKSKDVLIRDEFDKFLATIDVSDISDIEALRYFFIAYISDPTVRSIIDNHDYPALNYNPTLNKEDFIRVDERMRDVIPTYIKTYIRMDKFIAA